MKKFDPLAAAFVCLVATLTAGNRVRSAEPATVADAAATLDLETLAIPPGAELTSHRRAASLYYRTSESAQKTFALVESQLNDQGWDLLPGGHRSGVFASGDFGKQDYVVHVSVTPAGEPGVSSVQVSHQGNVAPASLPVPDDAESLYAFTAVAMYKSPRTVAETVAACRERMLADGWTPYGGAPGTDYYRKNAVQADIGVQSAPGQGGATVISLTTRLLSLELPGPPFADDFRYTDVTTAIEFDCDDTPERVAGFYREALATRGWKATLDKPTKVDWKLVTVLRNAGQEMITLSTHDFEGRTRAFLDHQNANEVAEDDEQANVEAGRVATYRFEKRPTVEAALPAGLEGVPSKDWACRVEAPGRDPFAVATEIVRSLEPLGWSSAAPSGEGPAIRAWRLVKGDREIRLVAAKPPNRDPWVAIAGLGVNVRAR